MIKDSFKSLDYQCQLPLLIPKYTQGMDKTIRVIVMYFYFSVILGMNSIHGIQIRPKKRLGQASARPLKKL